MTEEARGTPERARRALAALELTALRHRSRVRRQLGVGDDELSALLYLAREGAMPQGRLSELTTLSRSAAGTLVRRLEQRGLVQRRTDSGDRRRRVVRLSSAGRSSVREAYAALDAVTSELLAERPDRELDALSALLDRLVRAAAAVEGEPAVPPPPTLPAEVPIWRRWG